MSRDHRKLRVFVLADQLVLDVYEASSCFPASEKYGLRSQLRRAALSAATNIVEGSARRTDREYVYCLNIAAGSSAEARYLASVAARLNYLESSDADRLDSAYRSLSAMLHVLISSLDSDSSKP
jgi:four helix bundle protein